MAKQLKCSDFVCLRHEFEHQHTRGDAGPQMFAYPYITQSIT